MSWFRLSCLRGHSRWTLALVLCATVAFADPPDAGPRAAVSEVPRAPARLTPNASEAAAPEETPLPAAHRRRHPEFQNHIQGGFVAADFGGSELGATVFGKLGITSSGTNTLDDRRWLLQWDASFGAKGGVLAKDFAVNPLVGGAAGANVEAGRRFHASSAWSPYVGLGLDADVQVMASTQVPFSQLNTLGSLDDTGGLAAGGAIRVVGGASNLEGRHSLVVTGFFQSQLRLPALGVDLLVLNGGGVHIRWDIAKKLIALLDGFVGVSPRLGFTPLSLTRQLVREQVTAGFRYAFLSGSWIGAQAVVAQDFTTTRYTGAQTFGSTAPPSVTLSVEYGLSFGESK